MRYVRYVAIALELQEQEDFRYWVLSQQDPKKFRWATSDHAGTTSGSVQEKILQHMGATRQTGSLKGDVWDYGSVTGMQKVFKVKVFDSDTGEFLRFAWADETGKEIDVKGAMVIESQHPGAREAAKKFFGLNGE